MNGKRVVAALLFCALPGCALVAGLNDYSSEGGLDATIDGAPDTARDVTLSD